jgi:hypothetical protein
MIFYKMDKRGFLEAEFIAMLLLAILVVAGMKSFELVPVLLNGVQEKADAAALVHSQIEGLISIAKDNFDDPGLAVTANTNPIVPYNSPLTTADFAVTYTVFSSPLPGGPAAPPDYCKIITVSCDYGPDRQRHLAQTTWITR